MINYLDIRPLMIYKSTNKFNLILNPNDKYKNSAILLLTNSYQSTVDLITSPLMVNRRYVRGYYYEPFIRYYLEDGLPFLYDLIDEDAEANQPTTITSPKYFRNPTKPRVKSRTTADGEVIRPAKKSLNMARDPKALMRHLRYDMRRAKYKLNTLKGDRANIGGQIHNPKAIEKNKELMIKGKTKEVNRKKREKWIEDNLKNKDKTVEEAVLHGDLNYNKPIDEMFDYTDDFILNESYFKYDDTLLVYNLNESTRYSNVIKQMLYKDRIISDSRARLVFKDIRKTTTNKINLGFTDLAKYNQFNIFYDLSQYSDIILNGINAKYGNLRGYNIYKEFLEKQINNRKLKENGYDYRLLIIRINDFVTNPTDMNYTNNINPISCIIRALKIRDDSFLSMFTCPVIFLGDSGYFKVDFTDGKIQYSKVVRLINRLTNFTVPNLTNDETLEEEPTEEEEKAAKVNEIISKIEDESGVEIKSSVSAKPEVPKKKYKIPDAYMNNIRNAKPEDYPSSSTEYDDEYSDYDEDGNVKKYKFMAVDKNGNYIDARLTREEIRNLKVEELFYKAKNKSEDHNDEKVLMRKVADELNDLENDTFKPSVARSKRMQTLANTFNTQKIHGKTIGDLEEGSLKVNPIKTTNLTIDSPNKDWKSLKRVNFEKSYDIHQDIAAILKSFMYKDYPIAFRNITVENTSTSQDAIETYTLDVEDSSGKRSKLKFDMPIIIDDNFMLLMGNKKTMHKQVAPIPVCKIDDTTSQITSNYKKVTVSKFGSGSSNMHVYALLKILESKPSDITFINMDVSSQYNRFNVRPIDFIDIASTVSEIRRKTPEGSKVNIIFDSNKLMKELKIDSLDSDNGFIYGYRELNGKKTKLIYAYDSVESFAYKVTVDLDIDYNTLKPLLLKTPSLSYSRAKIFQANVPVVVLLGFYIGLFETLRLANIKYGLVDKKVVGNVNIKFKDYYLTFKENYEANMLMNGLTVMDTELFNIKEFNKPDIYISFFNSHGLGDKIDGFYNFKYLMDDPITVNCAKAYSMPTDFMSQLVYASDLLVDNKYAHHTNMNGRRIRSIEVIAGYLYQALAQEYQSYAKLKRLGRDAKFSMKQSAVIDLLMQDPTFTDMPLLNDLQIFEANSAVSYKGLSGLNNDRAYSLDKRTYDPSMLNVVAMATGFAGNVGINRQLTIDANIDTNRGFVGTKSDKGNFEPSVTKSFCMAEAITPLSVTRNDPMRSAMNFIQTTNHSMRVNHGSPSLVTTGADQALPYLSDNTFSYCTKESGIVKELTEDYMVIEYKSGKTEMIDLRTQMLKNSSSGFYTSIKLKPNRGIRAGSKFKENTILAYDPDMYSSNIGNDDSLSYNLGTLAKVAILNTDEGFEDSAMICESLATDLSTKVIDLQDVSLSVNTNILNIVKVGDPILEGDPLIVFQDAGDEKYQAELLKSLNVEKDKYGIGTIPITSHVSGRVVDIKIYRTAELSEMTSSLKSLVRKYENGLKPLENKATTSDADNVYKYRTGKLPAKGKLKKTQNGVLIEFYLEYIDRPGIGDKIIYLDAVKGVTSFIPPKGLEPYSEFRPDEEIQSTLSKGSLDARMVTSVRTVGAINKALVELDRSIKEELGIPFKMITELGKDK